MVSHVVHEELDIEDGHAQQLDRVARPGDLFEFDKGHDIAVVSAACMVRFATINPGFEDGSDGTTE